MRSGAASSWISSLGSTSQLSNSNGNLALYDGPIPLTGFGLGSRRLAGVATQQLTHAGKGVLLIDEVEYGLEPHRLVNLLTQLQRPGEYALALATTHSLVLAQRLSTGRAEARPSSGPSN